MASRTGIHISGHYVRCIVKFYAFSYMYFEFFKNERSDRIVFYIVIKLNDHQTMCINFELR